MIKIYPSLINANILNLQHEIMHLEPHCDGFHLDVMDNHFVPNLTWGPKFINAIATACAKPVWVHLMVDKQHEWIDRLALPIDSTLSIHIERQNKIKETIKRVKEKKWKVSLAISPKTLINKFLSSITKDVDQILIMSVEPGFSGQTFISDVTTKIKPLIEYRRQHNLNFSIAMDGGINQTNIAQLIEQKVHEFAIASGIYSHINPIAALNTLYKKAGGRN